MVYGMAGAIEIYLIKTARIRLKSPTIVMFNFWLSPHANVLQTILIAW